MRSAPMDVVGLGAGLTPSADDALVGALCLFSADDALPGALRARDDAVARGGAAAVTTDVSLSYLRLALRGAFSSSITRVVGHLAETSSEADLDESVGSLSRLGALSGMDTLWVFRSPATSSLGPPAASPVPECGAMRRRARRGLVVHDRRRRHRVPPWPVEPGSHPSVPSAAARTRPDVIDVADRGARRRRCRLRRRRGEHDRRVRLAHHLPRPGAPRRPARSRRTSRTRLGWCRGRSPAPGATAPGCRARPHCSSPSGQRLSPARSAARSC